MIPSCFFLIFYPKNSAVGEDDISESRDSDDDTSLSASTNSGDAKRS